MAVNWEKTQQKADEVLKHNTIKTPFVDIYAIADHEGLNIIPLIPDQNERPFSGFLDSNGEKPVIYVNATERPVRQNWTIAHELGHYFLQHPSNNWGINWRDKQPGETKDEYEQASDYFAACLLIPKNMLRHTMRDYRLTNENFELLANIFGVSSEAMKNRLNFLHL